MRIADALYSGYGEAAGGGIRGGKQAPIFEGGNAYLRAKFPKLDYVRKAQRRTVRRNTEKHLPRSFH